MRETRPMMRWGCAIGAVVILGCVPTGEPIRAVVARYDRGHDRYEPGVETLSTLSDAFSLSGSAARVRARGDVSLAIPGGFTVETVEETVRRTTFAQPGDDVSLSLLESGGVVLAADYPSFSLLTFYHHLERAQAFLVASGAAPQEVEGMEVLYLPRAEIAGRAVHATLFYVNAARAIIILGLDRLEDLPPEQNEGTVAHELTHGLWDARVLDELATYRRLSGETPYRPINLLDGIGEGVADFIGATLTG